jgi:hypothetical protein
VRHPGGRGRGDQDLRRKRAWACVLVVVGGGGGCFFQTFFFTLAVSKHFFFVKSTFFPPPPMFPKDVDARRARQHESEAERERVVSGAVRAFPPLSLSFFIQRAALSSACLHTAHTRALSFFFCQRGKGIEWHDVTCEGGDGEDGRGGMKDRFAAGGCFGLDVC